MSVSEKFCTVGEFEAAALAAATALNKASALVRMMIYDARSGAVTYQRIKAVRERLGEAAEAAQKFAAEALDADRITITAGGQS